MIARLHNQLPPGSRRCAVPSRTKPNTMWDPSFISLVSSPVSTWQPKSVDCLRAHLAIIGMQTSHAPKADLRLLVPLAIRLAAFRGLLAPQILQPFTCLTLPSVETLRLTSAFFRASLAFAARPRVALQLPPDACLEALIQLSRGPINGSVVPPLSGPTPR